ncbi:MAG: hypothetical protein LBI01_05900, partial [Elusimicrobium sp.]|nr:hypothetical protein [Elusimicrobium sp.]
MAYFKKGIISAFALAALYIFSQAVYASDVSDSASLQTAITNANAAASDPDINIIYGFTVPGATVFSTINKAVTIQSRPSGSIWTIIFGSGDSDKFDFRAGGNILQNINLTGPGAASSHTYGGLINMEGTAANLTINNNAVFSNGYAMYAGAIRGQGGATLNINALGGGTVSFLNNTSSDGGYGGGAILADGGNVNIKASGAGSQVLFSGNTAAAGRGGAIYGYYSTANTINIAASDGGTVSFLNNTDNNAYGGGALNTFGTKAVITADNGAVIFSGNKSTNAANPLLQGGAVFIDSENPAADGLVLTTTNNGTILFDGNSYNGGARDILIYMGHLRINGDSGWVRFNGGIADYYAGDDYVNKDGGNTLILAGDNSNYTDRFLQTGGATKFTTSGTMFGTPGADSIMIQGGEEQIVLTDGSLSNVSKAKGTFSLTGALAYLAGTSTAITASLTNTNSASVVFLNPTNVIFGADYNENTGLPTVAANYILNADGDFSKTNLGRVIFRDSALKLNNATYNNQYGLDNTTLDLRTGAITSTTFANLTTANNSKLSFDISFDTSANGLSADKLTDNTTGQTIGIGDISVLNRTDYGMNFTRSATVLSGMTFAGPVSGTVNSSLYTYLIGASGTDITLTATGFTDGYSLNGQNILSGTRNFDFGVYGGDTATVIPDYVAAADLDPTAAGAFAVLGRNTTASDSVIDADGHSLFNISGLTDLTVRDLTIKNASIVGSGAVLVLNNADSTANFINTVINNSTATGAGSGGAIDNAAGRLSATDTTFSNNSTLFEGGAISNADRLTISGTKTGSGSAAEYSSVFDTNHADAYGGAVFNSTSASAANISGTDFTGNSAGQWGGAIYNEGAVTVDSSSFDSNAAGQSGGAIVNAGLSAGITDTSFTSNSAANGGAVYNYSTLIVSGSTIGSTGAGNTANEAGGGIYNTDTGTVTLTNTDMGSNAADYGGAIENAGGEVNISGGTFAANKAETAGGAIENKDGGQITIDGAAFNSNTSGYYGGVIYQNDTAGIITVSNSSFDSNKQLLAGGFAGVIYNTGTVNILGGTSFTNNGSAGLGGVILSSGNVTLDSTDGDIIFSGNTGTAGGAIYNGGAAGALDMISQTGNIITFSGNSAADGGAVYNTASAPLTISGGVSFDSNTASDSGGAVYNDKVLNIDSTGGTLNFTGNSAASGGAIFNTSAGTVSSAGAVYDSNTAGSYGGAIYNEGTLSSSGDTFNNAAGLPAGATVNAVSGGAIYNSGAASVVNITDNTFENLQVSNTGGVIYNELGTVNISGSTFDSNKSGSSGGGAIYNSGTLYLNAGNVFQNSSGAVNASEGGAIYNVSGGTVNIAASNSFNGLISSGNGGAIYNSGIINMTSDGSGNITFSNNEANGAANDIYNTGTINVNGTAGDVVVGGGITGAAAGVINKSGAGRLIINGGSSGYLGELNNTAGQTIATAAFFGGTSNITGGDVELADGSSIAGTSVFSIGAAGALLLSTSGNITFGANQVTGNAGTYGTINKTATGNSDVSGDGSGTLTINGDNSGFTGAFNQTAGTTIVTAAGRMFGGGAAMNNVSESTLQVTGNGLYYGATLGDNGILKHYQTTAAQTTVDGSLNIKFAAGAAGADMNFGADTSLGSNAVYQLAGKIDNGGANAVTFDTSNVTFSQT